MARTSQTARKRTGPPRPRKTTHHFTDHSNKTYTVVDPFQRHCPNPHVITKLSIHLYSLGPLQPSPEDIGQELLKSNDIIDWANARNWWPRVDVYSPLDSIEACIEHHRREKTFRRNSKEEMHRAVAATTADEEEAVGAVRKLRGKEPLPHIVPTWCRRRTAYVLYRTTPAIYRGFILVVPAECTTWEDIQQKGLWMVRFDQDVPGELTVQMDDDASAQESLIDDDHGWVQVDSCTNWGPPHCVERVSVNSLDVEDPPMNSLYNEWVSLVSQLYDCTYRPCCCDGCDEGEPHENCEVEMSEHFFDEDGDCVECRRAVEQSQ
ncbi:hypothetical protein HFD88_008323 [Aspergillus terreus]|nr:hypothetical protein HFD88_008323 [Aspergillus terreus]